MMNDRLGRFTFPTETLENEQEDVGEKLANRFKDARSSEKSKMDDFDNFKTPKNKGDFEDFSQQNHQKNIANTDIFNPTNFTDAQTIADQIINGNNAIVNLEQLLNDPQKQSDAMRIIDFICGVAYALKIEVKRVNASTFLFTLK